jgi:Rha family phage regulatory protein
MSTDIQLVKNGDRFLVSSKEIAAKFGKKHYHVLEAYRNLITEIQDADFIESNFRCNVVSTLRGEETTEVLFSRDGFVMLVMGFTGAAAVHWRIRFLAAFNSMEQALAEEMPRLQNRVRELETQIHSNQRMLSEAKRPHKNKNTVLVPTFRQTIFEDNELVLVRVPRNDPKYSESSYKEAEMMRLSSLMQGMARKVENLTREIAILRRK